VKALRPLSDDEAVDIALSMSQIERRVIILCSKASSPRYPKLAEKIGVPYSEVQSVGRKLQAMHLAHVSIIPFNGSALFLNDRGESVKGAVGSLTKISAEEANQGRG